MRRPTHKVAGAPNTRNPRMPNLPRAVRSDDINTAVDKLLAEWYKVPTWDKVMTNRKATWAGINAIIDDYIVTLRNIVADQERILADMNMVKKRTDKDQLTPVNKQYLYEQSQEIQAHLKEWAQLLKRAEDSVREIKNLTF